MEIKVGDSVTFDGYNWFEVTKIVTEDVKTRKKGSIVFTKLYFGESHQPMYSYNVKDVKVSDQNSFSRRGSG